MINQELLVFVIIAAIFGYLLYKWGQFRKEQEWKEKLEKLRSEKSVVLEGWLSLPVIVDVAFDTKYFSK